MKDRILLWLATGETGISSKTMAFCAIETNYEKGCHPYDPADLRRCMLLVEQIPEIKDYFPKIAKLSDTWGRIIDNWDTLIDTLKTEMESGDSAPVTYKMLQKIRKQATA